MDPVTLSRGRALADAAVALGVAVLTAVSLVGVSGIPLLAPFGTAAGVVTALWLVNRRGEASADIGLRAPHSWVLTILAGLLLLAIVLVLLSTVYPLLEPRYGSFDASRLGDFEGNVPLYLYALFVSWVLAAFGEETLFRGFVQTRLRQALGSGRTAWFGAALLQSILFGLGHVYQGWTGVILTGLIGLTFGLAVAINRRHIWACVIAHGLIDTLGFTGEFVGRSTM
jgi:membrane protease YdiL (CAAX protease family)